MQHAIRFEGSYERNFSKLQPDSDEYEGEDGRTCTAAPWPESVSGLRYGFMEQPGKRFVVVRVRYGDEEVLLQHPVRLDPSRHLGGKRFSAQAIPIDDSSAGALLGDVLDANREQQAALSTIREHVRANMGSGARRR
jgi:hypothetical protein